MASRPTGAETVNDAIERETAAVESQMVAWRRDIHEHPELGNREFRTSALVAEDLKKLGYDLCEKVAHTGVVAVLMASQRQSLHCALTWMRCR